MKEKGYRLLVIGMLTLPVALCMLKATCILRGPANPDVYLTDERRCMFRQLAEKELHESEKDDDEVRYMPDGTVAQCLIDKSTEEVHFRMIVFRNFIDYHVRKGVVECSAPNRDLSFFQNVRRCCLIVIVLLVASAFFKWTFVVKVAGNLMGFFVLVVLGYIIAIATCISTPLILTEAMNLYRLETFLSRIGK